MRVANAPVSWGVMEFDFGPDTYEFGRVLDEIRASGYQGSELGDWGFLPTDPVDLRRQLESRDLALVGAFVPVNLRDPEAHDDGADRALRTARLLSSASPDGAPLIVLADENGRDPVRTKLAGRIEREHGLTNGEWETFARGAERIAGRVLKETGLRTVFHHHCAGFVEAPWELRQLMEHTDSELVGLCLDTGHYRFGGGDPAQAVAEYGSRIWHVHLKDFSPRIAERARENAWDYFQAVEHGIFCELGEGQVDFPGVLDGLRQAGYSGWLVVEQDVLPGLGSPLECAKRNRAYLERVGV